MNREALFSDGTSSYVIPPEPKENEKIRIRFRTAKDDVDEVLLIVGTEEFSMEKVCSGEVFDYYEVEWQLSAEPFTYYFKIKRKEEVCYYNRCGASDKIVEP